VALAACSCRTRSAAPPSVALTRRIAVFHWHLAAWSGDARKPQTRLLWAIYKGG